MKGCPGGGLVFVACMLLVAARPPTADAGQAAGQGDAASAGEGGAVGSETAAGSPPAGILPIPDYSGSLAERSFLLGDWGGARTSLAERGVQLDIDFVQHVQSIVSGGRSTGTEYGGSLDYLLRLDLQRLDAVPGALVTFRGESRYGESINGDVGLLLPANTDLAFPLTNELDDDLAFTITELTYTQFLSKEFALFAGKLNTLGGDPNEFASGRGKTQFQNAAFVFNPVTALAIPYSTLGGGFLYMPSERLSLTTSIFNSADSSTTTGFDNFGDGWTVSVEAATRYSLGDLPGGQNLGFIYADDGDFLNFNGRFTYAPGVGLAPPTSNNTWSLYWSGWQYLWAAEGDERVIDPANGIPDRRGVGLFARAGIGDDDTLPIDWHVSLGVGGRGLGEVRPDDHYGIGYYYSSVEAGRLSSLVALEDHTQGFEAFYNLAITPAARLTFDFQAVSGPLASTDTAVVIGARLQLVF